MDPKLTSSAATLLHPGSRGFPSLLPSRSRHRTDELYQWSFPLDPTRRSTQSIRSVSDPNKLFPDTLSLDLDRDATERGHGDLEASIDFIRAYHPEIDVPSQLLADELVQSLSARRQQRDERYVDRGQLVAVVPAVRSSFGRGAGDLLVVSAGGENQEHLFISRLRPPQEDSYDLVSHIRAAKRRQDSEQAQQHHQPTFEPFVTPVTSFSSPILQIVAAPDEVDQHPKSAHRGAWIAVRTSASLIVYSISRASRTDPDISSRPYRLNVVHDFQEEGVLVRPAVDFCFHPSTRTKGLLIDCAGNLMAWKADDSPRRPLKSWTDSAGAVKLTKASSDPGSKVAFGSESGTAFVMTRDLLQRVDLDTKTSTSLYRSAPVTKKERETLTSMCVVSQAASGLKILAVSTTLRILFYDLQKPRSPPIAISHQRATDSSLHLSALPTGDPTTIDLVLSSRNNRLTTSYSVALARSSSSRGPELVLHRPSLLPCGLPPGKVAGSPPTFYDLRSLPQYEDWCYENGASFLWLDMAELGSLWLRIFCSVHNDKRGASVELVKNDIQVALKQNTLARTVEEAGLRVQDPGPFGHREVMLLDFEDLYRSIMEDNLTRDRNPASRSNERLENVLRKAGRFLQALESPLEALVTPLEIISAASLELDSEPAARKSKRRAAVSNFLIPNPPSADAIRNQPNLMTALVKLGRGLALDAWTMDLRGLIDDALPSTSSGSSTGSKVNRPLFQAWTQLANQITARYYPSKLPRVLPAGLTIPDPKVYRENIRKASDQIALDLCLSSFAMTNERAWAADDTDDKEGRQGAAEGGGRVESTNWTPRFTSETDPTLLASLGEMGMAPPPEIKFTMLRPRRKAGSSRLKGEGGVDLEGKGKSREEEEEEEEGGSVPGHPRISTLTARLLLDEWRLGSSPLDYRYEDPYASGGGGEGELTDGERESSRMLHSRMKGRSKVVSTNNGGGVGDGLVPSAYGGWEEAWPSSQGSGQQGQSQGSSQRMPPSISIGSRRNRPSDQGLGGIETDPNRFVSASQPLAARPSSSSSRRPTSILARSRMRQGGEGLDPIREEGFASRFADRESKERSRAFGLVVVDGSDPSSRRVGRKRGVDESEEGPSSPPLSSPSASRRRGEGGRQSDAAPPSSPLEARALTQIVPGRYASRQGGKDGKEGRKVKKPRKSGF